MEGLTLERGFRPTPVGLRWTDCAWGQRRGRQSSSDSHAHDQRGTPGPLYPRNLSLGGRTTEAGKVVR